MKEIDAKKRLINTIWERTIRYFGHITRRDNTSLERTIMNGLVKGKRRRGRPPSRWLDQIGDITGLPLEEAKRKAMDRDGWRIIANGVAIPLT